MLFQLEPPLCVYCVCVFSSELFSFWLRRYTEAGVVLEGPTGEEGVRPVKGDAEVRLEADRIGSSLRVKFTT